MISSISRINRLQFEDDNILFLRRIFFQVKYKCTHADTCWPEFVKRVRGSPGVFGSFDKFNEIFFCFFVFNNDEMELVIKVKFSSYDFLILFFSQHVLMISFVSLVSIRICFYHESRLILDCPNPPKQISQQQCLGVRYQWPCLSGMHVVFHGDRPSAQKSSKASASGEGGRGAQICLV